MTTTADAELRAAEDHVRKATEHLSNIVVSRVWGWEDFSPDYQEKLTNTFHELLTLRNRL